jgi:hypothetical protein
LRIRQTWLWLSGLGYHLALGLVLVHGQLRYGFLANPLAAPPSVINSAAYAGFVRSAVLAFALLLGISAALIGLGINGRGGVWLGAAVLVCGVTLTALAFATLPSGYFVDDGLATAIWRLWLGGGASTYLGTFLATYCVGALVQRRRSTVWVAHPAD